MADTLLLADDEAGITALMRQYFEAAGYRVVCASSGRRPWSGSPAGPT